jgi:hypothetical protein
MSARTPVAVLTLLAGLVVAAGAVRVLSTPAAADLPRDEHVVIVGVPGLDWSDVTGAAAPRLRRLATDGAVGDLTTRSAASPTCPWDGWISLGAGNRARFGSTAADTSGCADQQGAPDLAGSQPFTDVVQENDDLNFGAIPGLLGTQVRCTTAIGAPAVLAVSGNDSDVRIADPASSTRSLRAAIGRCPLTLVAPPPLPEGSAREGALRNLDALVARLSRALDGSLLIVAGISESGQATPHLHPVVVSGRGIAASWLQSASTGTAPYAQLIDLAPTAVDVLGGDVPSQMAGRPLLTRDRTQSFAAAVADLADLDVAATEHKRIGGGAVWVLALLEIAVCVCAVLVLRRRGSPWLTGGLLVTASLPVATFLANALPWWRATWPALTVSALCLGFAVAVAAASWLLTRRRAMWAPMLAVATTTAAVIGVDVLLGSRLQRNSLFGYDAVVAGRFSGIGNMPFGFYASGAIFAYTVALAYVYRRSGRRGAVVVAVAWGVALLAVNGAPGLGADVGGVIALTPALVLTAMLCLDVGVSAGRLGVVAVLGFVLVAGIAVADHARPAEQQTHLGRFVGQVVDGTAWTVVSRKGSSNLYILTHSPLSLMMIAFVLTMVWGLRASGPVRRTVKPYGHAAVACGAGILTIAVLGSALNDSGIAVFGAAGAVAVPLLLALTSRTLASTDGNAH